MLYEPSELLSKLGKVKKDLRDYVEKFQPPTSPQGPQEGDTKTIFGKPATFSGGQWLVDQKPEGGVAEPGATGPAPASADTPQPTMTPNLPATTGGAQPPVPGGPGSSPPAASGAPQIPIPIDSQGQTTYIPPDRSPQVVDQPAGQEGPTIQMKPVAQPGDTTISPQITAQPGDTIVSPQTTAQPGPVTPATPIMSQPKTPVAEQPPSHEGLAAQLTPKLGFRQKLRGAPQGQRGTQKPKELSTVKLPIQQRRPKYLRDKRPV